MTPSSIAMLEWRTPDSAESRLVRIVRRIAGSRLVRGIIIATILVAGALAGLETNAAIAIQHDSLLRVLDAVVLAVFIAEIALKITAHGSRPLDYFRDGWNVFDFTIVAICLLPVAGPFAAVLRLVRTLRLLRLVSALPKLQLLIGALLKSLHSMGYVALLLGLMFYIYAVIGTHLFGAHAPGQFGSLGAALLALFQIITLDNWSDLLATARAGDPIAAPIYFISFILLGTMIMLNLFIGIIMNSMAEMHTELDSHKAPRGCVDDAELRHHIAALERHIRELSATLGGHRGRRISDAVAAIENSHQR